MIIILMLFHLLANLIYLYLDQAPPAWDQAFHLKSVVLTNQFLTGQFWGSFVDLIKTFYAYPPMVYFLTGLASLLTGLGESRITFFNSFFFLLALMGMYKLSLKVLKNKQSAFLATLLFSLMPVVYEGSRNFLLDMPLLTWVIWGLYFFVDSRYLTRPRSSLFWTLTLIFSSLTKLNGFLYYLPMIVFALYQSYREKKLQPLINLVLGFLLFLTLVGWWYLLNSQNILTYTTGLAGQGEPLTDPSGLLNLANWIHYFRLFFLQQLTPIPVLLILLSFIFWPKLGLETKKSHFLFFYLFFNYVLFTLINNKDYRFTFPLLPIVTLLSVANLRQAPKAISWILFAFLGFYFLNNSFNWPIKKPFIISTPTYLMGNVDWIAFSDYPVRSPKLDRYPNQEIVADLSQLVRTGQPKQVLVLINLAEINDNTLNYYHLLENNYRYYLHSASGITEFKSETELEDFVRSFDFLLVPDQSFEPAPFYNVNIEVYRQARDWIFAHEDEFIMLKTYEFQTKKLYLYAKNSI